MSSTNDASTGAAAEIASMQQLPSNDLPLHAPSSSSNAKLDDVVERVVLKMNSICRKATFDFSISIGQLVIDNFYGGKIVGWRKRGPKHASLRRLAKHPDLPMSAGALYRCVAIYELCQRLGASQWKHVCTSHVRVVLPLQPPDQVRLLIAAESHRWPVRRLTEEVAKHRGCASDTRGRGGRKALSHFGRTVRVLQRCLTPSGHLLGADDLDVYPAQADVQSVLGTLRSVMHACAVLETLLARTAAGREHTCPGYLPPPPPPDRARAAEEQGLIATLEVALMSAYWQDHHSAP